MTRILLVEDEESYREPLEYLLRREGYDVVTTMQTVGNARHVPSCDLVIIDFHMPGLDGLRGIAVAGLFLPQDRELHIGRL